MGSGNTAPSLHDQKLWGTSGEAKGPSPSGVSPPSGCAPGSCSWLVSCCRPLPPENGGGVRLKGKSACGAQFCTFSLVVVALPAPALAQATPALCVSFVKPVLCTVDGKALRLGREDTPAHQNGSPLRREGYISRLTKCTASSRTTARSQSSATSLLAR
jgi:hypothetical protein